LRERVVLRWVPAVMAVALIFLSFLVSISEVVRTRPPQGVDGPVGALLDWSERRLLSWGDPLVMRFRRGYHLTSGYGLFRVMTTKRPEIVIEASEDGRQWVELEFRWKPGELSRRPGFCAPHQPRLDWQMWFAALNYRRATFWLEKLLFHILEGTPQVVALLGIDPTDGPPPRYVRLQYYEYEFSTPEERRETGNWWKRTKLGRLTGPVSRESFRRQP